MDSVGDLNATMDAVIASAQVRIGGCLAPA
jgi:hypothetical protein